MESNTAILAGIKEMLSDCTLCPRNCHVDRLQGRRGFCGETAVLRAARAALYYTEEPVISGRQGSGTVFFTGCNLGCIYCQNRRISRPDREQTSAGPEDQSLPNLVELSPERLAEIFFELEAQGAHNINLVTPEHFVPLLIPALKRAKEDGLGIPVVYNTGSYERVEAVKALEGLVDVWLPELKYVSAALSARHTGAADYFQYASAAISEMVRQCPQPVFSDGSHTLDCPDDADDPLLVRGVLVRHLALPGCAEDSRAVLRYLHETYGNRIFISIMNQYTPMPQVLLRQKKAPVKPAGDSRASSGSDQIPPGENTAVQCEENTAILCEEDTAILREEDTAILFEDNTAILCEEDTDLCRCLSREEYDSLVDYAIDLGIENGFIQESGTVSPSYIPVFDGTGILPRAEADGSLIRK